jgi:hypothetical protein
MSKTFYYFDEITGEYTGSGQAHPSPLEPGKFLIPTNGTEVSPPSCADRQVAVWTQTKWEIQPDWRGVELFSIKDGASVQIDQIGIRPEEREATPFPRPGAFHAWHPGEGWVEDQNARTSAAADAIQSIVSTSLEKTDRYFINDETVTEADRAQWLAFRASLRALHQRDGYPWDGPASVDWPGAPFPVRWYADLTTFE